MRLFPSVFAVLLATVVTSWSTVLITVEAQLTERIASACRLYAEQNDGAPPSSWDDLASPYFEPWDETYKAILPTKRYAFLAQPVSLGDNLEIVIMARRPFRDLVYSSEVGRRVVIHGKGSDQYGSRWINEEDIQRLFRAPETLLPEPDQLPSRMRPIAAFCNPIFEGANPWSVAGLLRVVEKLVVLGFLWTCGWVVWKLSIWSGTLIGLKRRPGKSNADPRGAPFDY